MDGCIDRSMVNLVKLYTHVGWTVIPGSLEGLGGSVGFGGVVKSPPRLTSLHLSVSHFVVQALTEP